MNDVVKKIVPRLRFQSFKALGPWGSQTLGQLAQRSIRKNAEGKITRVLTNSAEYGVVDQRDFFEKDIANQGNLEGYYVVEEGYYVYNPRVSTTAPVGPISKNKIGLGVMSPLYMVFKFNNSENDFYAHYFKSTHWHQYMRQVSSTGARHDRMNISNNAFMKLPLPVCTPEEQQKIADCLSSLDDLLTAEVQKLDTLKKYKQGLMQQLFPREGESVPRLRFPEFQSEGEWVYEKIGDCLEKLIDYRGKAPPKAESGVQLITAKNVRFGWLDMSCNEYISADEYESWMSKGIPRVGDILFTTEAPLGNVAFFPCTGKFALGQRIITLRTKPKKCLAEFLFQALLTPDMQKKIDFHSTGSTAKGIKSKVFVNLSFCYPKISEQQKIAEVLSSLDNFIAAQSQKLDVLKNHKKGLMQQLFPVFDEILA
ncbi:TPA: restriction endonuclease subunit S [Escherichia coli]|uniref:restriction endonuclease subunit S n=1 Tax=Escherichia coli TaxID=562 RepID=UPI000BE55F96|nr:restriction endonuclease subunit S [Escherichia coli]EEY7957859.1 restriction endonuclease subunit S [Escherichia coli]EFB1316133.1 restriction endonuclease subunit S [Escherichia coli]EFB2630074.1 restriction endonuclease subunit S [Escherichia coli]EFJ3290150.1 restriction endonuclease subunit S [Escherichia coli]EFN7001611.1 restriction endonuclease subunit S [Escherichia coli]